MIRGEERQFRQEHPATAELVVEVCVTRRDYDRSKLPAYASAGVKECWLVLGPERQIEVHRAPANGQSAQRETHGPGGKLASSALPDFTLDLDAFFNPWEVDSWVNCSRG